MITKRTIAGASIVKTTRANQNQFTGTNRMTTSRTVDDMAATLQPSHAVGTAVITRETNETTGIVSFLKKSLTFSL